MKYVSRSVSRSAGWREAARRSNGGARFPVQDLSLGRYCEGGTCATKRGRGEGSGGGGVVHTPKIEPERANAWHKMFLYF